VVSRRQLVMDILRHCKRRNGEQEQNQPDRHSTLKKAWQTPYGSVWNHCGRATYHRISRLVKRRNPYTNPVISGLGDSSGRYFL
jgi:hypothetical protein